VLGLIFLGFVVADMLLFFSSSRGVLERGDQEREVREESTRILG